MSSAARVKTAFFCLAHLQSEPSLMLKSLFYFLIGSFKAAKSENKKKAF